MKKAFLLVFITCLILSAACGTGIPAPMPSGSDTPTTTVSDAPAIPQTGMPSAVNNEEETEPSATPAPAIELVATAPLPAPDADWYEWDKAGNYPGNPPDHSEYYIKDQDLFAMCDADPSDFHIEHLDGTDFKVLDKDVYATINYFDGWFYYTKPDGVYKIKPDGSGKQQLIKKALLVGGLYTKLFVYESRMYLIQFDYSYIESYNLAGQGYRKINLPYAPIPYYFFSDGYFYYGTENGGENGCTYRCDLSNGDSDLFCNGDCDIGFVYKGWAYYSDIRTNGTITESLEGVGAFYNMYANYGLYFSEDGYLHAYDVNIKKDYSLFDLRDFDNECPMFVTQDGADFIYYLVTFENNTAKLWYLNDINYE